MANITVRFESSHAEDAEFPVVIERVDEHLFLPEERGDADDMTVLEMELKEAINEAEEIVGTAPGFDHIDLDRLWEPEITATVVVEEIQ